MNPMLTCNWCEEAIHPCGILSLYGMDNRPCHKECLARQLLGSLAHIEGRCGCYVPGSAEGDPPGLSRREAARQAVRAWRGDT